MHSEAKYTNTYTTGNTLRGEIVVRGLFIGTTALPTNKIISAQQNIKKTVTKAKNEIILPQRMQNGWPQLHRTIVTPEPTATFSHPGAGQYFMFLQVSMKLRT
jgi:hypothetical protein